MIASQKCLVCLWYMIHTPSFSSLGVVYQEWEVEYPQTSFLEIVNGNILTRKFCERLMFYKKIPSSFLDIKLKSKGDVFATPPNG